MHYSNLHPYLLSLILLAGTSCDTERIDRGKSAGDVPIVHTAPEPLHSGPLFELHLDLELGIDDGEPEWQLFASIQHTLVAPDGRIIALNAGEMSENISSRYSLITDEMKKIRDFIEVPPQQVWHDVKLGGWGYIPYTVVDGAGVFTDGRIFSYHPYQPRITIYSPEGDPVLHIDHDWEFPKVTVEEKERFRSTFRDHPGNEKFRHWATDTPIPDRHAAFDFVIADDRDRIWVQRTSPERSGDDIPDHVFDVFDSNGVWLGIQELPHQPLHILDGCVYFIYKAESAAPRFARYRLVSIE